MAANDELFRILLEVIGTGGIDDLKSALAATKQEAASLGEQYERGEIGQKEYLKGTEALAREAANYQKSIEGLERAHQAQAKATEQAGAAVISLKGKLTEEEEAAERAGKGVGASMGKIGAGGTDAAYKLQVLGGTLDDLQYVGEQGLRPILGNIMQISPAVGIALLAFDLMRKAITAFTGDTAEAGNEVERLKKRVEDLEKTPHKLKLDIDNLDALDAKLNDLEKRLAAFEAGRQTAQEADLAKQALDVTRNYGGSEAFKKSVLEMEKAAGVSHGEGADEMSLRDKQGQLDRMLARTGGDANMSPNQRMAADVLRKEIGQLQAKVEKANRDWAEAEVGAFNAGEEGAIARMQNRAAANPGAFSAVGPRGIDAAEAIGNLPRTQAEARMRAEKDAADRQMEQMLKGQREDEARREEGARQAEEAGIRQTIEAKARREAMAESTNQAEEAGIRQTIEAKARREAADKAQAAHDKANNIIPTPALSDADRQRGGVAGAIADEMSKRANSPAWRAAKKAPVPRPIRPNTGQDQLDRAPEQQPAINPDGGGPPIRVTSRAVQAAEQLAGVAAENAGQIAALAAKVDGLLGQVSFLKRATAMNNGRIRGMNPQTPGSVNPMPFAGLS